MSYLSQFHHQILGNEQSSKKLVFLHGLMGYGMNWRSIARAFTEEFHILYYDQRGHGRSISPPEGYAPEDFAEDLKKIINELGWSKIYLVGHSMGGRAAATFAHLYPENVHRLVVEDIGPDAHDQAVRRIEEIIDGVPLPFDSKKAAKEYFLNDFRKDFAHRPNVKALGSFLYSNLAENSEGGIGWKFDKEVMRQCVLQGRQRERFKEFSEITVPTLLMRGEKSEELSS